MKTLHQHISEKLIINKNFKKSSFELQNYIDDKFFIEILTNENDELYFRVICKYEFDKKTYTIKGIVVAGKTIKTKKDRNYARPFSFDKKTGLFIWKMSINYQERYRILFPMSFVDETLFDNIRENQEISFEDIEKIFNIGLNDLIRRNYLNKHKKFKVKSTDKQIEDIRNTIKFKEWEV